jgi:hypothetical protein
MQTLVSTPPEYASTAFFARPINTTPCAQSVDSPLSG